jgi:hypothetical protein
MRRDINPSLHEQVRQAVHRHWDPIGVAAYSDDLGEYDGYIPALCALLEDNPTKARIFEYLWKVETESMGLVGDRQLTEEFADWLYSLSAGT